MDARAIIAILRQGGQPTADQLRWFAQGLADGGVTDAQAGAFAMAVVLRGLSAEGRVALTLAMRDSGDVLTWRTDAPVIDKHSTGGVGDCVSLILAPALAACGAAVPMISGRGLGHTGGTLDKMEAIPGVSVMLEKSRIDDVLARAGCAIVGATGQIAPADKRLYAIRDVTATVESLDLITASILSKKLAAGLQALVLDVKVGSGAFMKTADQARTLAQSLVATATQAGCPTTALITDMNQPLVPAIGNAVEVDEVMRVLTGAARGRIYDLTCDLGAEVLTRSKITLTLEGGRRKVAEAIDSGAAAERFGQMVAAMGGPVSFVENWRRYLPEASVMRDIPAQNSGYVSAMNGEALGLAVVALGGGRQVETDRVDPSVGFSDMLPIGAWVDAGQPIARIHAARMDQAAAATRALHSAITISDTAPDAAQLVYERITG